MKMKSYILLVLLIASISSLAQEKRFKSKITKATVYSQGAQIIRVAKINLDTGENQIVFTNLPPKFDESSIQVSCEGAMIVSVSYQKNLLDSLGQNSEYLKLLSKKKEIEKKLKLEQASLQTLEIEKDVLLSNKQVIGDQGIKLEEFKQSIIYFRTRLDELEKSKVERAEIISSLKDEVTKIQKQMDEYKNQLKTETGEILVNFKAEQPLSTVAEISYFTQAAGWFPNYDIRVNSVTEPFALQYKANIFQTTGEDWKKIKLLVSSGNPTQGGTAPELTPWYLDFQYAPTLTRGATKYPQTSVRGVVIGKVTSADDGMPVPGVSVIVDGTSIGTVTDLDGNYKLTLPNIASSLTFSFIGMVTRTVPITSNNISISMQSETMELDEVVTVAYGIAKESKRSEGYKSKKIEIPVTRVENKTSLTFQIDLPYDIPSTGRSVGVTLNNLEIPSSYKYSAVPKLLQDAFLVAEFTDWTKYNLLDGEVNLYLEDKFVGTSVLQVTDAEDTIQLSLGKDEAISIKRAKVQSYKEKNLIGNRKTENREFEILVRNGKKDEINILIADQIPITTNEEIKIKDIKTGSAILDSEKGMLTWEIKLKPNETKKIRFGYSIEYPSGKTLVLE